MPKPINLKMTIKLVKKFRQTQARFKRREERLLGRTGAYTRGVMKQMMRRRKNTSSSPGDPPHARTGIIRDLIYFKVDEYEMSVYIGPIIWKGSKVRQRLLGGRKSVPDLLNDGGVRIAITDRGLVKQRYAPRPFTRPARDIGLEFMHEHMRDLGV